MFGKVGGFAASLNLSALTGTNGFQINGEEEGNYAGSSVASAGDINGDGFDDLIIGAYRADPYGGGSGASYVVFGAAGGFAANLNLSALTGTNGFQINGEDEGNYAGISVASAGDINGDGFDDLIIGASQADPNGGGSGASYVVFGAAGRFAANLNLSALNGTTGFQINGEAAFDYSGISVASAGDINGDGFDDLIIGAVGADPNGIASGASYVVFGAAGGFSAELNLSMLTGTNGFQINGQAEYDYSGGSVASAGDINGDGFDDLIIGAMYAGPNGGTSGASYVVFGSGSAFAAELTLSTLNGTNGFKINGEAGSDLSGRSVASAGDVNGDGFDDIVIGASSADPNGSASGASYIIFGRAPDVAVSRTGTDVDNTISGGGLDDTLNGLAGDDTLNGGAGGDLIYGDLGNDVLNGGAGNDVMYGGAGNDVFVFDSLNDIAFDTSGVDELRATFSVNLASTAFAMMENAALLGTGNAGLTGSAAANVLTGNAGRNVILGGAGSDTIGGGAGNDTITGGAGRDVLMGGLNNDVFKFVLISEMTINHATTDVIMDFRRGQDKIDLLAIDASTKLSGNNKFTFDGKTAHGTSKEGDVYFKQVNNAGTANDYTLIFIDTDADRASEGVIKVMGLHNFTAGDFIL